MALPPASHTLPVIKEDLWFREPSFVEDDNLQPYAEGINDAYELMLMEEPLNGCRIELVTDKYEAVNFRYDLFEGDSTRVPDAEVTAVVRDMLAMLSYKSDTPEDKERLVQQLGIDLKSFADKYQVKVDIQAVEADFLNVINSKNAFPSFGDFMKVHGDGEHDVLVCGGVYER